MTFFKALLVSGKDEKYQSSQKLNAKPALWETGYFAECGLIASLNLLWLDLESLVEAARSQRYDFHFPAFSGYERIITHNRRSYRRIVGHPSCSKRFYRGIIHSDDVFAVGTTNFSNRKLISVIETYGKSHSKPAIGVPTRSGDRSSHSAPRLAK
jgi:hypothetical protein